MVDEFVVCQQERACRGEIGPNRRNALVKSARLMLEFQETGTVVWRMMSPDPDLSLSEGSRVVLKQFAAAASLELAPGSVRLLAGEIRQFLAYLDRAGRGALGTVTADDVRGFLVEVAPRRLAGTGNVVWSLKRFFAFLNAAGLSGVRVDGLLARAAPRRVRALPCFTREETDCLIKGIDTGTPCGKRDYAMVVLAVSTGLRCCDIVALRLDEVDWRRDEIRLVGYTGSGQPYAFNGTQLYQPYYENVGVDQTYHVSFYPGISINQGTAVEYQVDYDGHNGSLGFPQFETWIKDSSGTLRALGKDELYYATDHEFAASEIETSGETNTCPNLTVVSPYQTFGTNSSGDPSSTYALELESSSGGWSYWSGYPSTQQLAPYYFAKLYGSVSWPETFQTNGPS